MQVDAGEFIGKLRDRLSLKLEVDEGDEFDVLAAFDRSCVEVLVDGHQQDKVGRTSGQKAAATRKRNKAERAAQAQAEAPELPTVQE